MTQQEFLADPAFDYPWYHTLEIFPDLWTPGCSFDNLVATRTILNTVDVAGQRCLDIGAMEGLISYLLERRKAARVVAYDRSLSARERVTNGQRFELARRALGSSVDFVYDVPFVSIHDEVAKLGIDAFDLVVFSGVLYHMFDPMAALAQMRNMTRTGGVAVIETAGILSPERGMYANSAGRFYGSDDYWFISAGCLEYWLRFLHFQPLDCCYVRHMQADGHEVVRMAVSCRALPGYLAEPADAWMRQQDTKMFAADFDEFFRPPAPAEPLPPVTVHPSNRTLVWRDQPGGILDIHASLVKQGPLSGAQFPELLRLGLADH